MTLLRTISPRVGLRICSVLAGAAATLLAATTAQAQTQYPTRDVTWVVGFTAGGFFDVTTRYFAERLGKELGKTFLVENKPGGAGMIAVASVAQAKPDGYTILNAGGSTWNTQPFLNKDLPYKPDTAFTLVHGVMVTPSIISVPASSPFKTLKDVIEHAKANPGKLKFGAVGLGTPSHLAGELLWQEAGVKMNTVIYKGGSELTVDNLGGRIDVSVDVPSSVLPQIQEGKMRPLLTTTSTRVPAMPDVPTAIELGYPAVQVEASVILVTPAGTPKEAVDALSGAMKKTLADPETVAFLAGKGLVPLPIGGDELKTYVETSTTRMKALIETLGLTAK